MNKVTRAIWLSYARTLGISNIWFLSCDLRLRHARVCDELEAIYKSAVGMTETYLGTSNMMHDMIVAIYYLHFSLMAAHAIALAADPVPALVSAVTPTPRRSSTPSLFPVARTCRNGAGISSTALPLCSHHMHSLLVLSLISAPIHASCDETAISMPVRQALFLPSRILHQYQQAHLWREPYRVLGWWI